MPPADSDSDESDSDVEYCKVATDPKIGNEKLPITITTISNTRIDTATGGGGDDDDDDDDDVDIDDLI